MSELLALVGDIGGTNARLALCDLGTGEVSQAQTYSGAEFESLQDVILHYCAQQDGKIEHACIAIACPITGDWVSMTNHSWAFSIAELKANCAFKTLEVINDFTAVSLAIPVLPESACVKIGGGEKQAHKPVAVYGAGTGLGVAQLIHGGGMWHSIPGEGGHVDLPTCNAQEDALAAFLRTQFGRVSAERCLSGQGLVNIYQFIVANQGREPKPFEPKQITEQALDNSDSDCVSALELFCTLMGRFGGNLALTTGAFGGVYIAGGIVPRFKEWFAKSGFRAAFEEKGRFNTYLQQIPVYLITHNEPGLLGAGTYIRQRLDFVVE